MPRVSLNKKAAFGKLPEKKKNRAKERKKGPAGTGNAKKPEGAPYLDPARVKKVFPAVLVCALFLRTAGAALYGCENPYFRVSGTELAWKALMCAAACYYARSITLSHADPVKVTLRKIAVHAAPLAGAAFIGALLCGVFRYGPALFRLADTLADETLFTAALFAALLPGAFFFREAERYAAYCFLVSCFVMPMLRIGSDTFLLMAAEYAWIAVTGFLAWRAIGPDPKKTEVCAKTLAPVFALLLFAAFYAVVPHGRQVWELTGVFPSRAASTDRYEDGGRILEDYGTSRFVRPVLPVEASVNGAEFYVLDKNGKPLYKVRHVDGPSTIHLTDCGTHVTEVLEERG